MTAGTLSRLLPRHQGLQHTPHPHCCTCSTTSHNTSVIFPPFCQISSWSPSATSKTLNRTSFSTSSRFCRASAWSHGTSVSSRLCTSTTTFLSPAFSADPTVPADREVETPPPPAEFHSP